MSAAFDAASLERNYAFLDDCPENLFDDIVTLPIGTLAERVSGARRWHDALLAGRLPPDDTWPPAEISNPVRMALTELGLVRFCKDQPELVDKLMKEILAAFTRQAGVLDVLRSKVASRLRELETLERERLKQEQAEQARRKKRIALDDLAAELEQAQSQVHRKNQPKHPMMLTPETMQRLREQAMQEMAQQESRADSDLLDAWGERARAWAEIADVFGDLGE
ncbi:MAG: hypothetical protein NTZ64_13315, partial [Polaromonas sp.]|nr:hypothetical protein [Polaromonas sp.]